jgi:RNA-directed DNA polymerase
MDNKQRQNNPKGSLNLNDKVKPNSNKKMADLSVSKQISKSPIFPENLMEVILQNENVKKALVRVETNKGSPGIDGMSTDKLRLFLRAEWPKLKQQLRDGSYQPMPVKRVEIPKPDGSGVRNLGIPTVLDRFIQQSVLQVLQDEWDKTFSESSYGFRPGRSAHQAIVKAQLFIESGKSFVVDIDLEKFFDRINHDKLMSKLALHIEDKNVLKLIRKYLESGVMVCGLVKPTEEGSPQGGPLSPWLSNVVLDELDKELELRGHSFCRYADDCNIYVKSRRAGDRVMKSISEFITRKLKLKVNIAKSAVDQPHKRKFLGFSFTNGPLIKRTIAPQAIKRFKIKIRILTNRNRGESLKNVVEGLSNYLIGWSGYFGFCQSRYQLKDLDGWIRRRLRCMQWRQWATPYNRYDKLRALGIDHINAARASSSSHGPWKMGNITPVRMALSNAYFDSLKLPRLVNKGNI